MVSMISTVEPFDIAARSESGWMVFDVTGDLDVYSAPSLRRLLHDHIDRGDTHIIVNLERVDFLDSTGISALIGALKRAQVANGTLALVRPSEQIQRLLELTHLNRVLRTFAAVDEVLGSEPKTTSEQKTA